VVVKQLFNQLVHTKTAYILTKMDTVSTTSS